MPSGAPDIAKPQTAPHQSLTIKETAPFPMKKVIAPNEIALPALDTAPRSVTESTTSGNNRSTRSRPPKTPPSARQKRSTPKRAAPNRSVTHRECVCGRGVACLGMTQAFRMLQDPRCYFVELPRYRKDPPAFKYVFRNNLRQAYLRELVRQNPTCEKLKVEMDTSQSDVPKQRKYVALHHFHPTVVRAFYENPLTSAQKHKVPISITEHELSELNMVCREEDRILSVSSIPTGGYYFTPNYPHEKAHSDLKVLIQAVRNARVHGSNKKRSRKKKIEDPNVPTNIEITSSKSDVSNDSQAVSATVLNEEKETEDKNDNEVHVKEKSFLKKESDGISETDVRTGVLDSGDGDADEFDKIWEKSSRREIESSLLNETIIEEEEYAIADEGMANIADQPHSDAISPKPRRESLSSRRSVDRPWATPKYRRDRDTAPRRASSAAHYIDPDQTGELNDKLATEIVDDGEDIARIAAGMTVIAQDKLNIVSPTPAPVSPKRDYREPPSSRFSPSRSPYSPFRRGTVDDDAVSLGSADSGLQNYTKLDHQLPGADPTLRIQVHNDLIAWESKRRSDLVQQLEYNRERWRAASDVLADGIAEAKYAERLILGISKASRLFADSLRAVYDDKLLDDKGNAVKNTFLRNRLAKQRSAFEYSIENTGEDFKEGSGLGSVLLDSIVSAQLDIANAFVENSDHMEREILPELTELKEEVQKNAQRLQAIGDTVISELKQSEIEVKNIWDVFDAMVTGDLMEYTTHGSSHGGSSHGGSHHSSSMNTGGSGSVHGFLTPADENEAPIVSSSASPLVKSTFLQLGRIEDGWLIEMYYKSAVAFQRSVFGAAEMELCNLVQEISMLEEMRFQKLHQFMLAFAPRQRRLFNKLPEQLKTVLENMVGLRIDEESLQKVLDESVKDRSKDHLKGSTAHKSSILNRSKINARVDSAESEIEYMEKTFGSPFASPMIVLSKMVELKTTGLKKLVNTAWKPSLCVVTSEGNILVFETSGNPNTPPEAFKSLYPQMNFDDENTWLAGRKADIVKSLTPTVSFRLSKCDFSISQIRKSQIEITEERDTAAGSRFMKAVKSGVRKCTLRLPSSSDATDWMSLLQRTKKVLSSQATSRRRSRLRV